MNRNTSPLQVTFFVPGGTMKFVAAVFAVVLAAATLVIYDANAFFPSAWAARAYFMTHEEKLDRVAEAFMADNDIENFGWSVDGRVAVTPVNPTRYKDEAWMAEAEHEYEALLRSLDSSPLLVTCNQWFKLLSGDEGAFCIGGRRWVPRIRRDAPEFLFSYMPAGAKTEKWPCKKSEVSALPRWTCDFQMSEHWTLHYEKHPEF